MIKGKMIKIDRAKTEKAMESKKANIKVEKHT